MTKPRPIDLSAAKLHEVLERVRAVVLPEDFEILAAVIDLVLRLVEVLRSQKATLSKLRRMIFGPKSEKTRDLFPDSAAARTGPEESADPNSDESTGGSEPPKKPKRQGHGRNPAKSLSGATTVHVPHPDLKPGSSCPACVRGRVRRLKEPARSVRFVGQPFVDATVYEGDRYRCGRCQETFSTKLPVPAGTKKYEASARSMLVVLKYGMGLPFNRIEKLQRARGVALPSSIQWELAREVYTDIFPFFDALVYQAAQNSVVYNDDTNVKIQALMPKSARKTLVVNAEPMKAEQSDGKGAPAKARERTGVFTTAIVSEGDGHEIVLYFSGRKHAGENLQKVLDRRNTDLSPPLQMCDGLSRNVPNECKTVLSNCLSHYPASFVIPTQQR